MPVSNDSKKDDRNTPEPDAPVPMASTIRLDKELEQFRNIMQPPGTFAEGFSWTSLAGAIFIALLMVPGAMYMGLLAGAGVGEAAQWVTVILFLEVARRAHKTLSRPELFVLFYMASAVMAQPFAGLLYTQFFVQSQAATGIGIADQIPHWVAPRDPDILAQRNFFNPAWYPALGLVLFSTIMGRLNGTVLSYGLFRLASDIEKLPFPMAPIGAQGITALAEQQSEETRGKQHTESWRWRVFSIGGVLGLSFGAVYTALPVISGAILGKPVQILPIPFVDWTEKTGSFLPAVATGLTFDLTQLIIGMVLPFFAMLGSFIGMLITVIANAFVLHPAGWLRSWESGQDTIKTIFNNQMDFYFSFGIGIAIALAIAGISQVIIGLRRTAAQRRMQRDARMKVEALGKPPAGRGDIPAPFILGTYFFTASMYILLSGWLIDWHPGVMIVLFVFAFLYTPLLAYVTARLEGMAGQVIDIPMVREASFIFSGYQGVAVWFMPLPQPFDINRTTFYRQAELTGTKFWSIWKTELILVPIVLIASIFFAQFIWSLAPIPGPQYPFAEKMWELQAANQSIIYSSTLGRYSAFQSAFNWKIMAGGAGFGLLLFGLMSLLHLPIMLIYGLVRGLNQAMPHIVIPQFIGALLGKFYFERKLGLKWRQYVPVIAAGFACGVGLITVLGVGFTFLARSVNKLPF